MIKPSQHLDQLTGWKIRSVWKSLWAKCNLRWRRYRLSPGQYVPTITPQHMRVFTDLASSQNTSQPTPAASEHRQMRLAVIGIAILSQCIQWDSNRTPAYRLECLTAYLVCLHMMIIDGSQNPLKRPGRISAVCVLFFLIEVFRLMEVSLWVRLGWYAAIGVFYVVDPDVRGTGSKS